MNGWKKLFVTYTDVQTYLIITQENKKSRLFSFDSKKWRDFLVKIRKVKDQLKDSGVDSTYLDGATARDYSKPRVKAVEDKTYLYPG